MTGIVLFFKIIYFTVIPICIVFILLGFGRKIFELLFGRKNDFGSIFIFLVSL